MILNEKSGKPLFGFIITAAGSSTRMGFGLKKEFRLLQGKPVIVLAMEAFIKSEIFSYGLVTCKPGTKQDVLNILKKYIDQDFVKRRILLCDGGENRQESVFLGLKYLGEKLPQFRKDGYVLIHDGARPWITPKLIKRVSEGCFLNNACAPIIPSIDAMKTINNQGVIMDHLERSKTVGIQTPQGFSFKEILESHKLASTDGKNYIDDTEIYNRYCGYVHTVDGEITNKKITYSHDIPSAKEEVSK